MVLYRFTLDLKDMELSYTRATEINRLHDEICGELRTTVQKAIRIGELLTIQKVEIEYQQGLRKWSPWVETNLNFDRTQAWRYMSCYRKSLSVAPAQQITIKEFSKITEPLPEEPEEETVQTPDPTPVEVPEEQLTPVNSVKSEQPVVQTNPQFEPIDVRRFMKAQEANAIGVEPDPAKEALTVILHKVQRESFERHAPDFSQPTEKLLEIGIEVYNSDTVRRRFLEIWNGITTSKTEEWKHQFAEDLVIWMFEMYPDLQVRLNV
jgi:hypothetical protein